MKLNKETQEKYNKNKKYYDWFKHRQFILGYKRLIGGFPFEKLKYNFQFLKENLGIMKVIILIDEKY